MYFHQHFLLQHLLSPPLPCTSTSIFTNTVWYIYTIYFHHHCLAQLHLLSPTLPGTSTCANIVWYIYTIYFHYHLPGATTPTFTSTALYNYNIYLVQHLLSPILPCTTSTFTNIALYNYNTYFHQYCLVQQQHLPGISTPTFTNIALYNYNSYFPQYSVTSAMSPFTKTSSPMQEAPSSTFTNTLVVVHLLSVSPRFPH